MRAQRAQTEAVSEQAGVAVRQQQFLRRGTDILKDQTRNAAQPLKAMFLHSGCLRVQERNGRQLIERPHGHAVHL